MENGIVEDHLTDDDGNTTGGTTQGMGISIRWQNGPLGRDDEKADTKRADPNGAFVEDVIQAAIGRLAHYQSGRFNHERNDKALLNLRRALACLAQRTADRMTRGVDGTHAV